MATTTTTLNLKKTLNLKDGTCVVMEDELYEVQANPLTAEPTVMSRRRTLTLQDYSGKVLRTLTIDEAKALLEAAGFVVE